MPHGKFRAYFFRFIQSQNFRTLLELESNGRVLTEDDIGRLERNEPLEPKKKDKRKSTFQVCKDF